MKTKEEQKQEIEHKKIKEWGYEWNKKQREKYKL